MPVFVTPQDFVLAANDDTTKAMTLNLNLLTTGVESTLQHPSAPNGLLVTASTEGNLGDFLKSGGGGGSANVWDSPANLGLSQVLATSNNTALSGAQSAVNLIASITTVGFYRVSWVATVIQAATTSSILGGATGFQLTFTDDNDNVVKTSNPDAVTSMTSAGNTTATTVSGVLCARCKAATALKYSFGYTSVGGTVMNYDLYIKTEFLG